MACGVFLNKQHFSLFSGSYASYFSREVVFYAKGRMRLEAQGEVFIHVKQQH